LDQNYIDVIEFNETYDLSSEAAKLITGLINYLINSEIKGLKFK
jgi:arginase family enzyme